MVAEINNRIRHLGIGMALSNVTERRLQVTIPGGPGPTTTYIDLALLYAAANHRMIKQANIFKASFQVDGVNGGIAIDDHFVVQVLPTTWPIMKAYEHGLEKYQDGMKDEMKAVKKARWNDFRIFFDTAHRDQDNTPTGKLTPAGCTLNFAAGGNAEYEYTRIYDTNGTNEYSFHMLGTSDMGGTERSFGMLAEYDRTDDTSVDETGALPTNYDQILNDNTPENETNLKEDGDLPPYNKDSLQVPTKSYNIHAMGNTASPGYTVRSTGMIDVPFGVVKITSYITQPRELIITFKEGRGRAGIDVTPCLEA